MKQKTLPLDPVKLIKLIQKDGLLSRALNGFESRDPQQRMMKNVIDAYNHDQIALIEAGTGTGKSMAYLIPALIWAFREKERTVISTHTIALQEQLVHKDIPSLIKILNLPLKVQLVKGMNNYICLRKLHDASSESSLLFSGEQEEIGQVVSWCRTMKVGSRSDLPFTLSPSVWEKIGHRRFLPRRRSSW